MGNNQQCQVKGIGDVKLELEDGSVKLLKSVRFVPDLKRNLISLGTLDKNGYEYEFGKGTLRVYKNGSLKLTGKLCSGLYVLKGKTVIDESNLVDE